MSANLSTWMNEPIAVVGVGAVLPDAPTADLFWQNLVASRVSVKPLDDGEWHWSRYASGAVDLRDHLPTPQAAIVEGFAFDWQRFRMPPTDALENNPIALMFVHAGAQALDQVAKIPHETTGVFVGATSFGLRKETGLRVRLRDLMAAANSSDALASLPAETQALILEAAERSFSARLRAITKDTAASVLASVAPGRLAMHFNLQGMHYAVDASFASALAALEAAVRSLRDGTLDLAVVGSTSETMSPQGILAFSALGLLGHAGPTPFDARADGTLPGEGVTALALKRLSDAQRDRDTVYALVRGVGGSSDGAADAAVPTHEGRLAAMRRAYLDADVAPESVSFVECDAMGLVNWDSAESAALLRLFADQPAGSIALGSAKANVGHLGGGAGGVSLLKTVLALHHGVIPPQAGYQAPHASLGLQGSPFFIPTQATALHSTDGAPIRAGVSAFGLGGVNYHAVLERYEPAATPSSASRPISVEPIAIVGMGAWMPGADSMGRFQQLLAAGRDMTETVPADKWPLERYYHPSHEGGNGTYTGLGAFAHTPPLDPRWGIAADDVPGMDPGHLMVLRATDEALADADFPRRRWNKLRTMVAVGHMPFTGRRFLADARVHWIEFQVELDAALRNAGVDDHCRASVLREAEQHFKAALPPVTGQSARGRLGNLHAARIAKLLDLRGSAYTIDSACASSQAALHAAVQALRHRSCDVAIVGGVSADLQPEYFVLCCRFNALSTTGLKPFDAAADGFTPGEGAGVLVLRRSADAERDGEPVHALIRSVAGSSDGRGRSVLAPRPEGEALAMTRALHHAGIDPALVDYVECHGAGTALGDPTEVQALTAAYGTGRVRPLMIGSVKSNIGHLNGGAGLAALLKAIVAVRDGVIPATLKLHTLNPQIDFAKGPIEVVTTHRPWTATEGQPRRAGVSSFGVGGSNYHVIVEQYEPKIDPLPIVRTSGGSDQEALDNMRSTVAGTSRRSTRHGESHRLALVTLDAADAARKLALAEMGVRGTMPWDLLARQGVYRGSGPKPGGLALLFPGQGGHYAGMLKGLAKYPTVAAVLAEADAVYQNLAGRRLSTAFIDLVEGDIPDEDAHCATLIVNVAVQRLLASRGIVPDFLLGQSAGALAAHVAANALTLADALTVMRARTLSVTSLATNHNGVMLALTCSANRATELLVDLPDYAAVAADNSPTSSIISATERAGVVIIDRCAAAGIECQRLAVSNGYHSQLIAAAQPAYRHALEAVSFGTPSCEIISSVTGESLAGRSSAELREILVRQLVTPVRFRDAIETLYQRGCRFFLQCGPKRSLTTFADEILEGRAHSAEATLHPKIGEIQQFARAIAWTGVHLDLV